MPVYIWSGTASSNATADSTINWAEGMAPSAVNDSARAMMAALAKYRDDIKGGATSGTSTAYTISTSSVYDTLAHLDGAVLCIVPHATNGASPTLNVDSLGAKPINKSTGVAIDSGALLISSPYLVRYSNSANEFVLIDIPGLALSTVNYSKIQNVSAGKFLGNTTTAATSVAEQTVPFGQCQLAKSGSNLVLSPKNGNYLTINSAVNLVPDAGVTLTTSGLIAATLYYVYAFMSGATMTLEAVTTAYATQAGTGILIKTGDATRTLVGMCYLTAGPVFADSVTQRYVRSYFNDPGYAMLASFSANRTTTSATLVEINSEIRISFLSWAGESVLVASSGAMSNGTSGNTTASALAFDGSVDDAVTEYTSTANNSLGPIGLVLVKSGLFEGAHYATLLGNVSAGTGTWIGSGSAGARTTMTGELRRTG